MSYQYRLLLLSKDLINSLKTAILTNVIRMNTRFEDNGFHQKK